MSGVARASRPDTQTKAQVSGFSHSVPQYDQTPITVDLTISHLHMSLTEQSKAVGHTCCDLTNHVSPQERLRSFLARPQGSLPSSASPPGDLASALARVPRVLGFAFAFAAFPFFALPFVEGAPFPFVEGAVEPEPEAFSVFTGFRRVLSVVISKMIRSWNEYRP